MKYIDQYFQEKNEELSFIEIKEDSRAYIKGKKVKAGISLPIITNDLIEKINTKDIEEIEIKYIIDGIIFLLGVDSSFKYREEYENILKSFDENIIEYILYMSMKLYEAEDNDKSAIYSRALLSLDEENKMGLFNYSLVLEKLGVGFIEKKDLDKANEFIVCASEMLNRILKIDDQFELAYYKLGYQYKYLQEFLKADLIWKKFIQISDNDILIQEIREELLTIEDDSNLEMGITYLKHMDFEKALDAFLKLMPKHRDNWNINYLIGQSYNGLNEQEEGINYMTMALEAHKEEIDVYNSLGSMYIDIGDMNNAIRVFTMGIDNFNEEYSFYFNRGITFMEIEDYEKAIKDMEKAHDLKADDEKILSILNELKGNRS